MPHSQEVPGVEGTRTCPERQDEGRSAKEDRRALAGFFRSPLLRVQHKGGLEAYVQAGRMQ